MAKTTKSGGGASPSFDPSKLTVEQVESVVEFYLGVHPKYLVYEGLQIKPDIHRMTKYGQHFSKWKNQEMP